MVKISSWIPCCIQPPQYILSYKVILIHRVQICLRVRRKFQSMHNAYDCSKNPKGVLNAKMTSATRLNAPQFCKYSRIREKIFFIKEKGLMRYIYICMQITVAPQKSRKLRDEGFESEENF